MPLEHLFQCEAVALSPKQVRLDMVIDEDAREGDVAELPPGFPRRLVLALEGSSLQFMGSLAIESLGEFQEVMLLDGEMLVGYGDGKTTIFHWPEE